MEKQDFTDLDLQTQGCLLDDKTNVQMDFGQRFMGKSSQLTQVKEKTPASIKLAWKLSGKRFATVDKTPKYDQPKSNSTRPRWLNPTNKKRKSSLQMNLRARNYIRKSACRDAFCRKLLKGTVKFWSGLKCCHNSQWYQHNLANSIVKLVNSVFNPNNYPEFRQT